MQVVSVKRHHFANCRYIISFFTKECEDLFNARQTRELIKSSICKIAYLNKVHIHQIEIKSNYVSIICEFEPAKSISQIVKMFKGGLANSLGRNQTIKWDDNFFAATLGDFPHELLQNYKKERINKYEYPWN